MKKLIYGLLIMFIASCSKDDTIDNWSNNLKITYQGYYEVLKGEKDTSITLTNIAVFPVTEQISETEEIGLLQIIATGIRDDSYITFKILPNVVGNNGLYNNEFEFRTPEGHPYSTEDIDQTTEDINFQVLSNSDTEFNATFSGTINHYSYGLGGYIYLEIKSGSINFRY